MVDTKTRQSKPIITTTKLTNQLDSQLAQWQSHKESLHFFFTYHKTNDA